MNAPKYYLSVFGDPKPQTKIQLNLVFTIPMQNSRPFRPNLVTSFFFIAQRAIRNTQRRCLVLELCLKLQIQRFIIGICP